MRSSRIAFVFLLVISGCAPDQERSEPMSEIWRFTTYGSIVGVGQEGDTVKISVEPSQLSLIRSQESRGDTVPIAVVSGIRLNPEAGGTELTPGNGFIFPDTTSTVDSIVFWTGRLTFRGQISDVYSHGTITHNIESNEVVTWLPAEEVGWRMARDWRSEADWEAGLRQLVENR